MTLACAIGADGVTRLAYGSVGPRPLFRVEETGVLADASRPHEERLALLDTLLGDAAPSPTSMRATPDYRRAMLRVLGWRAVEAALRRRDEAAA